MRAPFAELNLFVPFEQVDHLQADPSDVVQITGTTSLTGPFPWSAALTGVVAEYLEERLDGQPLTKQALMDSIRRITDLHLTSYLKLVKDTKLYNRLVNQTLSERDVAFTRYLETIKRNRNSQEMFAVALRRRCDDNVDWDCDIMLFLDREELTVLRFLRSFQLRLETEVTARRVVQEVKSGVTDSDTAQ